MNGDDEGGGKTTFMPSGRKAGNPADDGRPSAEESWFGPQTGDPPVEAPSRTQFAGPSTPPPEPTPRQTPFVAAGQIAIGSVLNNIYRVDRLIGQGGMGEVYEGSNVNTEERVAIKIILPQLAADPSVQTLFRNEARALIQLSHPGLVQYRLLAQEPQLKVLYIVTEFIDGPALSEFLGAAEVVGPLDVSAGPLVRLLRRLASALAVAHAAGIVHRDISPDNILLPGGSLEKAKIIDFGIAKDLAAGGKTIVGSGFAGKLGYVAPEQFGDSRDIGPWTDVYSLGLVALAVAAGRAPSMGVTFAEALERRRTVPDLGAAPPALQPVLSAMLEPDPQRRLRSMDAVVAALDDTPVHAAAKPGRPGERTNAAAMPPKPANRNKRLIGFGAAAAVAIGGVWVALLFYLSPAPQIAQPPLKISHPKPAPPPPPPPPPDPIGQVRQALAPSALNNIGCSWLDMEPLQQTGDGVLVKLTGVSGDVAGVTKTVSDDLTPLRVRYTLDTSEISPIQPSACKVIDAFRQFRAPPDARALTASESEYHLLPQKCGRSFSGTKPVAKPVVTARPGGAQDDFFLGSMGPSGNMEALYTSRAAFTAFLRAMRAEGYVTLLPDDAFQQNFCADDAGTHGVFLVKGKGPISLGIPSKREAQMPDDWADKFIAQARANGWVTDMAWYRIEE